MVDRTKLLASYVQELIDKGAIRSAHIEHAFRRVERDRFLKHLYQYNPQVGRWELLSAYNPQEPDPQVLQLIYSNRAIVTAINEDGLLISSTSQPSLVARMLELLELLSGARVLEIGTGTGYNAALLAEIVGDQGIVVSLDIHEQLITQSEQILKELGYKNIHLLCRDGFYGASEYAPYDRIVVTTGCTDLSPHWGQQLALDGFLLVPLQHGGPSCHPLVKVKRGTEQTLLGQVVGWSGFTPAQGELAWADESEAPWMSRLPLYVLHSEPLQISPLPSGLPAIAGNHPLTNDTHQSFYFFLALHDPGTCETPQGYGLISAQSAALITSQGICLYSEAKDAAATQDLYGKLLAFYRAWRGVGLPHWQEYQLQFVPRDATPGPRKLSQREGTWVISRTWFQQVVTLRA